RRAAHAGRADGNVEPEGGLQAVVTPAQLSVAVGGGKLTTVLVTPGHCGGATVATLAGQIISGASSSLIVTVNEQVGPSGLAQVTVVVPTEKTEPDAGEQVIVPQSGSFFGKT